MKIREYECPRDVPCKASDGVTDDGFVCDRRVVFNGRRFSAESAERTGKKCVYSDALEKLRRSDEGEDLCDVDWLTDTDSLSGKIGGAKK